MKTSICGYPRSIGGILSKLNFPSELLSRVMERSPSKTCMRTLGWLSTHVENICIFFAGTVVFLLIRGTITLHVICRSSERDVTSSRRSSEKLPGNIAS